MYPYLVVYTKPYLEDCNEHGRAVLTEKMKKGCKSNLEIAWLWPALK
jgi:hypothetical protein